MKSKLFSKRDWFFADKYKASIDLGLKGKDMSSRTLQVVYQRGNQKLYQYKEQIENAAKHIG